ncbi:hypothetical protein ACIBEA_39295 [Streptomyces sp. NPDC051555]|uniref:hypothetical protein n=1 Tax=Streptomyces sp. NPDC051555 TaxID=3365657 RepID=UPI0037946044
MTPRRAYAAARQLIDADADYLVHVRTTTGWVLPGDHEQRELPGLDVLLAARRVLRGHPAGSVWSAYPQTLNVLTGDGRTELRFIPNTLSDTALCRTVGCAELLPPTGPCPRSTTALGLDGRTPDGLWRVLGLPDSALVPVTLADLTLADLVTLAHTAHTLHNRDYPADTVLSPEAGPLLAFLAQVLEDLDQDRPHAMEVDDALSRTQLLTLAEAALALYRADGDPDDLLGRREVLLLAHLDFDDSTG